jgi:hypothetical protein
MGGTEGVYGTGRSPRPRAGFRRRSPPPRLSVSIGGGTSSPSSPSNAKPKPGTTATGVHVVEPGDEQDFLNVRSL